MKIVLKFDLYSKCKQVNWKINLQLFIHLYLIIPTCRFVWLKIKKAKVAF